MTDNSEIPDFAIPVRPDEPVDNGNRNNMQNTDPNQK